MLRKQNTVLVKLGSVCKIWTMLGEFQNFNIVYLNFSFTPMFSFCLLSKREHRKIHVSSKNACFVQLYDLCIFICSFGNLRLSEKCILKGQTGCFAFRRSLWLS